MRGLHDLVTASGFCPAARSDLRFLQGNKPGVVVVHVPIGDRWVELPEVDCRIIRCMNGARDLDAVCQVARHQVPSVTRESVVQLAVRAAELGLLANTPPQPPRLSVIRGGQGGVNVPGLVAAPEPPADLFERLEDDDIDEDTVVDPSAVAGVIASPTPPATALEVEPAVKLPPGAVPLPPGAVSLPPGAVPLPPGAVPVGTGTIGELEARRREPEPEPATPPAPEVADGWEVDPLPWHKRKRVRRLMYLGVFGAVIAALAIIQYPLYITEPAVVRPESQVVVRAPVEGIIAEVMVDEGDVVKAGQPLARLDDRELSYAKRKAEAEYDNLAANLDKMKSGSRPEEIRRAQALVAEKAQGASFARKELSRANRLYKSGDISQSKRDEARREYRTRSAELSQARAELKLVQAGFRSEEVEIAEANLRKAKADVDFYDKQLQMLVIRSPIDGKVLTPRFEDRLHEKLEPGDPVVEIGDATRVRVEITVPERDTDVIGIGQPVKLKVHSYPLQPFEGVVSFIAPAVEEKEGQRYIRVDAVIDNPDGILQPRMTGYGEINTGKHSLLHRVSRRAIRWVRVRFLI